MSTAAATVVVFAIAAALSFVVPQHQRRLLVVAVIIVPILLAAPGFVRAERAQATLRAARFAPPAPFYWPQLSPAFVGAIVAHVPRHASLGMVNGDLGSGWARWLAYVIAPRQLVTKPKKWTIVFDETPGKAGLYPTRSWRYGADWLVKR